MIWNCSKKDLSILLVLDKKPGYKTLPSMNFIVKIPDRPDFIYRTWSYSARKAFIIYNDLFIL